MSKIKVSKINIKIGKKEVALSVEEARELKELLNDLLGEQKTVYSPTTPIVIDWPVYPSPYRRWTIDWINPTIITTSNNTISNSSGYTCVEAADEFVSGVTFTLDDVG